MPLCSICIILKDLPTRKNYDQRWIFLTDESPLHTFFLNPIQNISSYNGFFNWSMTYRSDSDVPVPYGRMISIQPNQLSDTTREKLKNKKKQLAVMGSNCKGVNGRWNYVQKLKDILGNKLDIFGRCLNGNTTTCPKNYGNDCSVLNDYKFYLSFENSNCKEYITEKVFWNAYEKFSVPVIMGASTDDCQRLLQPSSYLHVNDFASPQHLVDYLKKIDENHEQYLNLHRWRENYRVLNEHGYFGNPSVHYCRICEALHRGNSEKKVYNDLQSFWSLKDCTSEKWTF